MIAPALAPPGTVDVAAAARVILASRSEEQAVAEVTRVLDEARKMEREAAASALAQLHDRLSRTFLTGRTLAVVMECSRYVRDGTLVWLGESLEHPGVKRATLQQGAFDSPWLAPHERVVSTADVIKRATCKRAGCEAVFDPRPSGHKGRGYAYCPDCRAGGPP